MRSMFGRCVILAGLVLSGCTSAPPASSVALPLSVGDGLGSQHGNYAARKTGETRGAAGERCVVFAWDRPLSDTHAVRYTSASCESKERPGWMVARQISRSIIPLSESQLVR